MKLFKDRRKAASFKERFQYWFDNRMSKGSLSFIRVLIVFSILLAVLVAILIIAFGFHEDGEEASVVWDSISTVINAWMPSYGDGSPGYVILMAVVALAGVLFTSVLIGIITSAIEEKIEELKKGNSLVLEKGHTVILGFYSGEYTLIQQLILSSAGKPTCIVVAENMDREEMEHDIEENIDVPKNFRIVCRTVDITDPASIEKCSVETSKAVIISPTNDERTIKAVLAVSSLLKKKNACEIPVNAIISKSEYKLPVSLAEKHNITTLQTNEIIAKMIAHSCTQTGLSQTFREVFNFEGCEFYLIDCTSVVGWSFGEIMGSMNNAVPAGIWRRGVTKINPKENMIIREGDKILVFSEQMNSAEIGPKMQVQIDPEHTLSSPVPKDAPTNVVIFGSNETVPIILKELPENVNRVWFIGANAKSKPQQEARKIANMRNITIDYIEGDPRSQETLTKVAELTEHIIILNDHYKSEEEADMETIFLLINLRDIRERCHLQFNLTVEMQKERNQNLVVSEDHSDFLVASSMSSLILAQLAESPDLMDVFREILSNEGNELYLKNAARMNMLGKMTIQELRLSLLCNGYVFLGLLDSEKESIFNTPLNTIVELGEQDYLILLGEH